jgi:uncharacterized protein (DUF2164 family)
VLSTKLDKAVKRYFFYNQGAQDPNAKLTGRMRLAGVNDKIAALSWASLGEGQAT